MKKPSVYLLISLLFSLGLAVLIENRIFQDAFALNDDVRNQIYWLARITNPHLFQHDYIAAYFTQPLLISPVVSFLYTGLAHWISPLVMSQFLPLVLVMVATFFLFRFCAAFLDEIYAFWVAFNFNCSIWMLKNLAGGLPRSFFYPLIFCLLWAMQTKRWLIMTLTVWLSALIYPPAFVLGLGLLLAEVISNMRSAHKDRSLLKYCGFSLAGSIVILGWRLLSSPLGLFGPLTSASVAERMSDLYPGGRIVLYTLPYHPENWAFPMNLLMFGLQRLPHLYILIPVLVFVVLLWLYQKFLHPRLGSVPVPLLLWKTIFVSGCLYVLAWCFLFFLYVPERYLEYTLFILPSFIIGGLFYILKQRYPSLALRFATGFIILGLTVSALLSRSDLMKIPQRERVLYTFLKTVPENAMIAAPPGLASNIPVYAHRSIFLSNEAYIPFHQFYFKEMKSRLKDWLLAYYAQDSQPLRALVSKYRIHYLIIQPKDFKRKNLQKMEKRYYHAFSRSFFAALKYPQPQDYFLTQVPSSAIIYRTAAFTVIDVKRLLPSLNRVHN